MGVQENQTLIGIFYLEVVFQRRSLKPHTVWNRQTVVAIIRMKVKIRFVSRFLRSSFRVFKLFLCFRISSVLHLHPRAES